MRKTHFVLFLFLGCVSCTYTVYTPNPKYAVLELTNEGFLIMPFKHSSPVISESNSKKLLEKLQVNSCATLVPFSAVSNVLYRNMISIEDSLTVDDMQLIDSLCGIRYILKSKKIGESAVKGFLGPIGPYNKELNTYFPDDGGRWLTYSFEIYDLLYQSKIYSLTVSNNALPHESEDETSKARYFLQSGRNMDSRVLRKGIRRLNNNFNCK